MTEERGRAFSLDSPEAFLECRMPVLRLFFLNSYLCISRGPFVLSRFLLVSFVFSSQSDTDFAIYGDGNKRQTLSSPEELMLGSSSSLQCSFYIQYNKICLASDTLIGAFFCGIPCESEKCRL